MSVFKNVRKKVFDTPTKKRRKPYRNFFGEETDVAPVVDLSHEEVKQDTTDYGVPTFERGVPDFPQEELVYLSQKQDDTVSEDSPLGLFVAEAAARDSSFFE